MNSVNFNLKTLKNSLLYPLSFLWEMVYITRRYFYHYGVFSQKIFKVPIISVGNLTFGGTGKTPFTIWLAEYLQELNIRPMVLMRGYKGQLEKSSGLIEGGKKFNFNPIQYGDEALLIAKRLKTGGVVVGRKRAQNLAFYFDQISPSVVLLDDGFQHLQLSRNLNIVLFDALLPISLYRVAPCGYLREGLSALKDADAIIIGRSDQVSTEKLQKLLEFLRNYHSSEIPVAQIKYTPTAIYNFHFEKICDPFELAGKDVVAVAALASPESFYNLLLSLGANIVEKFTYPDHYYFKEEDANEIVMKAANHNAIIISSEKDMVKLRKVAISPNFLYLEIKVEFISGESEIKEKVRCSTMRG